jgi:hypothetical protein
VRVIADVDMAFDVNEGEFVLPSAVGGLNANLDSQIGNAAGPS